MVTFNNAVYVFTKIFIKNTFVKVSNILGTTNNTTIIKIKLFIYK